MNIKSKIGIGITTHNSPERLRLALLHFNHFWLSEEFDCRLVVVDDDSSFERNIGLLSGPAIENQTLIIRQDRERHQDRKWNYIYNKKRLGIAKSKNECLKFLSDCDHIFLFDDDAWPMKSGWADLFIESAKKNSIGHLMYLRELQGLKKIAERNGIETYDNCGGVMLYLNKECLEKVGGYRKEFGIYGYEHADYSQRCSRAGLCGDFGPFISPVWASDFIYSIDFDLTHHNEQPPLANIRPGTVNSSIEVDKIQEYIAHNSAYYNTGPIFEELI